MTAKSVVIVEDDALIAIYLERLCKKYGVPVLGTAAEGQKAIDMIITHRPTHVFMDMRLEGELDGVDVGTAIYLKHPEIRIIYITGSNEPATRARIDEDHPYRILIKPINPSDLEEALA